MDEPALLTLRPGLSGSVPSSWPGPDTGPVGPAIMEMIKQFTFGEDQRISEIVYKLAWTPQTQEPPAVTDFPTPPIFLESPTTVPFFILLSFLIVSLALTNAFLLILLFIFFSLSRRLFFYVREVLSNACWGAVSLLIRNDWRTRF